MAKILVVDDREHVCAEFQRILEERGHEVNTAQRVRDAVVALEKGEKDRKPYEAAIIDLRFPGRGSEVEQKQAGMEVVDAALKFPLVEPIVLTGWPSFDTLRKAVRKGVFRYIFKGEEGTVADSELPLDKTVIDEVVEEVDHAVETRQVKITLEECLSALRESVAAIERKGIPSHLLDDLKNYLDCAEKAYKLILRTRGKHPDRAL